MKTKYISISTKLCVAVIAIFAVIVTLITTFTVMSAKTHNDEIMTDRAISSVKVLTESIKTEQTRLDTMADNLIVQNISSVNAEEIWLNSNPSDAEFMAIYIGDTLTYSTLNYINTDTINGITSSGEHLTLQSVKYFNNNTLVVGMDLSSTDFLDNIKNETDAEVTLFLNDVRYGTTVTNTDGKRATGTSMDTHVKESVLDARETYTAQTNIMGQNHYVCYEPMVDSNNNVIGAYFAGFSSAESDKSFGVVTLNSIVIAIISIVAISVIMLILIKMMITEPVKAVTEISKQMYCGDLKSADIDYSFSNDEIGVFADNLINTKHHLNDYISDISYILSAISEGDFTQSPTVEYKGDFVAIRKSFAKIEHTLGKIITDINTATSEVNSGASQISDSSQLLAEGAVEQASAIEELNSTIEDFSYQIKTSADNASKVHNLTVDSAEKLEVQKNDTQNLIVAMENIKEKSAEINKIIKVIDDIAFQTNILALNASIEAARAGDTGKGFAVVAEEVRQLAQKSADAVHHTEELINATLNAVSNGSDIVSNTVNTTMEVVEISNNINALINEIAEETNRQAEMVGQITEGINQISVVVQTNSATAEECAASAEELSSQSEMLTDLISTLKA